MPKEATKKVKSAANKSKTAMIEENEEKAPAYQEIVKASDQLDETDFASLDLFHVEVRRSSGEFLLPFCGQHNRPFNGETSTKFTSVLSRWFQLISVSTMPIWKNNSSDQLRSKALEF